MSASSNLIILDTETTGVDKTRDQIVELCIQFGLDGEQRTRRFKPSIPIPAEATAIHGITDADVADCPAFSACAESIAELLNAAQVIVAYNAAFDLDMLQAEFERAGLPALDLSNKILIDPLQLWRAMEPRDLGAAHARFVGQPHDSAHSAAADTAAAGRVLQGMLAHWGINTDWAELAKLADPMPDRVKWVGPSNHIQRDNGRVVFAFGKHKGVPVQAADHGFLSWVVGKDFPAHVKEICRAAVNLEGESFCAWVDQTFPVRGEAA